MKRTRKCRCGHTWNGHEPFNDGFGRILIVCMHVEHLPNGDWSVCSCKQYEEAV